MKSNVSQKFKDNVSILAITSGRRDCKLPEKNTFGSINFLTNRDFIEIDESKFNNLAKKLSPESILIIDSCN